MAQDGKNRLEWLASTRLSIILFGLLAVAAIPGTLLKSQRGYYHHPAFVLLLTVFALHLALCTWKRWRSLSRSTLLVHGGVLLTLVGVLLTATGYVATINIYEGDSADTVYRWDTGRDTPLGYELYVRKINTEFHPVPLQLGVMKNERKYALKTIKTGESFDLDGYSVLVDRFDPWREAAFVTVRRGAQVVGSADTLGISSFPPDFPYSFKLVAFKEAAIKRFWVDIELLRNGHVVTSGVTEINHPFNWNGLDFFNTEISLDENKRPYAGIQIVRDPGKYTVYAGMFILSVGAVAAWYRRFIR